MGRKSGKGEQQGGLATGVMVKGTERAQTQEKQDGGALVKVKTGLGTGDVWVTVTPGRKDNRTVHSAVMSFPDTAMSALGALSLKRRM